MKETNLKHNQVTETVREWLASGKYHCGDKLPADTILSAMLKVNPRTLANGLAPLVREGLLERAPRRGTIVKNANALPSSNAVALITMSKGHVYGDMNRLACRLLLEKELFPVIIEHGMAENHDRVKSFLECMTARQQPYGFLAEGTADFPYEMLRENPTRFAGTIFITRYHGETELPFCRYVLIDLDAVGRTAADYFHARGVKHLIFSAMAEGNYRGPFSSMQVQVMKGMKDQAEKHGMFFDEPLFWRLHDGAPYEETMQKVLSGADCPDGIFGWTDHECVARVMPALARAGLDWQKDVQIMGTYNTPWSVKYGFPSIDMNAEGIIKTAIEMLSGEREDHKIILAPKLVEHSAGSNEIPEWLFEDSASEL